MGKGQKEDPSKGLYFVKYLADTLNSINHQAKLAVLLPVACAIGTSGEIARLKREILEENTLDAVFTLPNEIFYPGASASACCMVFKIGIKHTDISNPDTFFGYCKDDGFKKKKNLGRVEQVDSTTGKSRWVEIEKEWIEGKTLAASLNISLRTLQSLRESGKLSFSAVGKKVYYKVAEVQKLLDSGRIKVTIKE